MPADSCRIMPARSISRWETISASFGVSRRIGRKKRDRRIQTLKNRVGRSGAAVKADRTRKYKRNKGLGGGRRRCRGAMMTTATKWARMLLPWGHCPITAHVLGGKKPNRAI